MALKHIQIEINGMLQMPKKIAVLTGHTMRVGVKRRKVLCKKQGPGTAVQTAVKSRQPDE